LPGLCRPKGGRLSKRGGKGVRKGRQKPFRKGCSKNKGRNVPDGKSAMGRREGGLKRGSGGLSFIGGKEMEETWGKNRGLKIGGQRGARRLAISKMRAGTLRRLWRGGEGIKKFLNKAKGFEERRPTSDSKPMQKPSGNV